MKLSEMQSSPDVGRPERTHDICVSGKLVAELERADRAYFEAEAAYESEAQAAQDDESPKAPKRMGDPPTLTVLDEAAKTAAAACDEIRARMQDHMVTLHLRAVDLGEWRRWVSNHPSRDEESDRAGFERDRRWAAGHCNIDDLIAELGDYVTKYGEEDPTETSWDFICANAAGGDLTTVASVVVGMHEQVVDLGKSRADWHATRRSVAGSA